MVSMIVDSRDLRLPETVVKILGGQKVAIVETPEGILLRPVHDTLLSARGFLQGKGLSTEEFFEMKCEEKELER